MADTRITKLREHESKEIADLFNPLIVFEFISDVTAMSISYSREKSKVDLENCTLTEVTDDKDQFNSSTFSIFHGLASVSHGSQEAKISVMTNNAWQTPLCFPVEFNFRDTFYFTQFPARSDRFLFCSDTDCYVGDEKSTWVSFIEKSQFPKMILGVATYSDNGFAVFSARYLATGFCNYNIERYTVNFDDLSVSPHDSCSMLVKEENMTRPKFPSEYYNSMKQYKNNGLFETPFTTCPTNPDLWLFSCTRANWQNAVIKKVNTKWQVQYLPGYYRAQWLQDGSILVGQQQCVLKDSAKLEFDCFNVLPRCYALNPNGVLYGFEIGNPRYSSYRINSAYDFCFERAMPAMTACLPQLPRGVLMIILAYGLPDERIKPAALPEKELTLSEHPDFKNKRNLPRTILELHKQIRHEIRAVRNSLCQADLKPNLLRKQALEEFVHTLNLNHHKTIGSCAIHALKDFPDLLRELDLLHEFEVMAGRQVWLRA